MHKIFTHKFVVHPFIVEDIDGAVDALKDVKDVDRNSCRTWAEERFSQKKMIDDYIDVYKRVLGR